MVDNLKSFTFPEQRCHIFIALKFAAKLNEDAPFNQLWDRLGVAVHDSTPSFFSCAVVTLKCYLYNLQQACLFVFLHHFLHNLYCFAWLVTNARALIYPLDSSCVASFCFKILMKFSAFKWAFLLLRVREVQVHWCKRNFFCQMAINSHPKRVRPSFFDIDYIFLYILLKTVQLVFPIRNYTPSGWGCKSGISLA